MTEVQIGRRRNWIICREKYPQLRNGKKKENQGHGATILYGYRCAIAEGADYIFQTDSDGQTLPEEFWKLWEDRKKCGLLIGKQKKKTGTAGSGSL